MDVVKNWFGDRQRTRQWPSMRYLVTSNTS
jgi:hypothetical protein